MEEKIDLKNLVSVLSDEKVRSLVMSKLVEKGIVSDPEYVGVGKAKRLSKTQTQFYEERQIFGEFARIVEEQRDLGRAMEYYVKAVWFNNAARVAEKIGDEERANKYRMLADLFS